MQLKLYCCQLYFQFIAFCKNTTKMQMLIVIVNILHKNIHSLVCCISSYCCIYSSEVLSERTAFYAQNNYKIVIGMLHFLSYSTLLHKKVSCFKQFWT